MKKRIFALAIALMMLLTLLPAAASAAEGDIVILFTNDVHCGVKVTDSDGNYTNIGYAGVAAYKKAMEAEYGNVLLVDAGDAIQGGPIGTLSTGEYIVDIMNEVGYDLAVLGNHEFDYGMERLFELAAKMNYPIVSANFVDLATNEPVYNAYEMFTFGDLNIAIVGVSTPESITKSTPTYFQNEAGEYIYGFCADETGEALYAKVQSAVDGAIAAGADLVICVGHLGTDAQSSPWMSSEVIANTNGINAFIDGHSHETVNTAVKNKDGEDVLLAQTGTKLAAIGKMVVAADGSITDVELISDYTEKDPDTEAFVAGIEAQYSDLLREVVASVDFDLVIADPTTGERLVRRAETNLGDLCADAYRVLLGADVAFVNGGGVRATIKAGEITYEDILNVHPFGNSACLVEATGQQILDALEMGSRFVGEAENGGFLHVSGLTYEIDTGVSSSVKTDENGMFVSVDGEYRVKNVKIGGQDLDPTKTYTLASHNYMLKSGGDGFTMFMGNTILQDEVLIDNQVLIKYITETLGGVIGEAYADPYGQGRITVLAAEAVSEEEEPAVEEPVATEAPAPVAAQEPNTGSAPAFAAAGILFLAMAAFVTARRRRA